MAAVTAPLRVHGRLLARNTLWNLLGHGLPLLVAIAAMPALANGLGPDRFGILGIAWMILSYLGELGFGRATTKFVAEAAGRGEEDRLPGIVWGTVAVQVVFGGVGAAAVVLSADLLVERVLVVPAALHAEARASLLLLAAVMPAIAVSSAFRGVLEAAQRFDLVNLVRTPVTIANYLLPLAAVLAGWSLPGVLALLLAGRIVSAAVFLVLSLRVFPTLRTRVGLDGIEWRELLGFGGWVSVSGVVSPILVYLDRFMLAALVSVAAAGYYTAPFEMVIRLIFIPGALIGAMFPAFSTLAGQADWRRVDRLAARGAKYVLLSMGAVAVVFVAGAEDLLGLWLGPDFARESATALKILAVGVVINSLAYIPFSLVQGAGRPDLPAKFHLLELPVQLVLVWALVSAWGIPGAALAWTLRVGLDAALLFAAARRLYGLSWSSFANERVPQSVYLLLGFGAVATAATAYAPALWLRGVLLAACALLLLVALWYHALASADRAEISRLLGLRRGEAAC